MRELRSKKEIKEIKKELSGKKIKELKNLVMDLKEDEECNGYMKWLIDKRAGEKLSQDDLKEKIIKEILDYAYKKDEEVYKRLTEDTSNQEGCGRIGKWFGGKLYRCGDFEDLKHSDHIILCPECSKKGGKG